MFLDNVAPMPLIKVSPSWWISDIKGKPQYTALTAYNHQKHLVTINQRFTNKKLFL
ncbi:hypothetical protein GCM10027037_03810 [Mucilaginibacter koreensis]